MDYWIQVALSNVVVSAILALFIFVLSNKLKPQWVHLMWLLVLLKLLTPPLVEVPVIELESPFSGTVSSPNELLVERSLLSDQENQPGSIAGVNFDIQNAGLTSATSIGFGWIVNTIWLIGIAGFVAVTLVRAIRFNSLLKRMAVSDAAIHQTGLSVSKRMVCRDRVEFLTVDANVSPMVWWFGGAVRIVVPQTLFGELSQTQKEMVLAHELAHVQRRDYLVRWFEWIVNCIFWWNPLVYLVRNQLRLVEEICCDQMVLKTLNPDPHTYAQSILTTVESLVRPEIRPPVPTSQINSGGFLERRFEMILCNRREIKASGVAAAMSALAMLFLVPVGIVQAQDFEKLERRLERLVEKGHIDEEHVEIMLEALYDAMEHDEHEHDEHEHDEHEHRHQHDDHEHGHHAHVHEHEDRGHHGDHEYDRRELEQHRHGLERQMREVEKGVHGVSKEIMEMVESGELSEEDGRLKLEAIRAGAHNRMRKIEAAMKKMHGDYQPRDEAAEVWRHLEMAVERGEITGEQADQRMKEFKQRKGRMRFREMEMKIKRAVDSGKLTEAEARRKIEAIKREMFGDGNQGAKKDRVQQREARMKYRAIEMEMDDAVEAGKMSEEEAVRKLEAIKREIFGDRSKNDRSDQKSGSSVREEKMKEIGMWLRMAVTDGEMTKEEAREKYQELVGMMDGAKRESNREHQKEPGAEEIGEMIREIRLAVAAGEMTREDAREKAGVLREKLDELRERDDRHEDEEHEHDHEAEHHHGK